MSEDEVQKRARCFKPLLLIVVTLIVGILARMRLAHYRDRFGPFVTLNVVGSDVSNAGGVSLLVTARGGYLMQDCNGLCDNLTYHFAPREDGYLIKLDDASGKCVLCSDTYASTTSASYGRIAGRDKLDLDLDVSSVKRAQ